MLNFYIYKSIVLLLQIKLEKYEQINFKKTLSKELFDRLNFQKKYGISFILF